MVNLKGLKAFVTCTVAAATIITAAMPVAAAATGKVTADVLNLRSGKSLGSSVIGKIPQNTAVNVLDSSDKTWVKVSYNNKTGYVSKEFISLNSTASASLGAGTITATSLNVRKTASTSAAIVGKFKQNDVVNVESKSGSWYYVSSGNVKGFVSGEYVTVKAAKGKVNADALNVRSGANLSSSKVGSLKKNADVTIESTSGEWYYVKSGSVKGYVFSDYITMSGTSANSSVSAPKSNTVQTLKSGNILKCDVPSLNVRKTPSTAAARVGSLVKGNQVTFLGLSEKDKNWYQVKTSKGITGYVHKDYVVYYAAGNTGTSNAGSSGATSASRGNSGSTSTSNAGSSSNNTAANASKASKIIATAKNYLGVKYVYGGTSPSGFDCSGFTSYVLRQHGVSVSRTSSAQSGNGTAVAKSDLKAGDLVFFSSSTGSSKIGHVGLYIGGGQFIHASSGSKYRVIISSLSEPFYVKTYKAARRVI